VLETMTPTAADKTQAAPCSAAQKLKTKAILQSLSVALFVMFLAECCRIFLGMNCHCVVEGKCYRSAQPTAQFIESMHRTEGIKSILNLRDENDDELWYQREKETAERLGIQLFNAGLCSCEQVSEFDFWRFVRAARDCPEPVLIHCANGNDRTGQASVIYLLIRTNTPLPEARRQLSLRYGHIPWSRASCLSRVLDAYENWLDEKNFQHTADHFLDWAEHHYRQEAIFRRPAKP
jgi:protein tyrosine phosphatase (PTP) superfamily phosphohydrolase (DUF442 family)